MLLLFSDAAAGPPSFSMRGAGLFGAEACPVPEEQDAEVYQRQLLPLVRPDRPVPVTVLAAGELRPGAVPAWRGDRVMAEYTWGQA